MVFEPLRYRVPPECTYATLKYGLACVYRKKTFFFKYMLYVPYVHLIRAKAIHKNAPTRSSERMLRVDCDRVGPVSRNK
jgi:hypothetical protein